MNHQDFKIIPLDQPFSVDETKKIDWDTFLKPIWAIEIEKRAEEKLKEIKNENL